MTSNQATESVSARLTGYGIDPTIVVAIIAAVIELLKSCKDRNELKSQIATPGPLARLIVRGHVRRELVDEFGPGAWFRHNGPAVVEKVLEVAKQASDEELEELAKL